MPISFFTESVKFKLKEKRRHKMWVNAVAKKHQAEIGNINYIFCSDSFLLTLNKYYLKHNTYTDIITFDYSQRKKISGEIYISIERVKENAAQYKVAAAKELQRVMIHGVLHLCGFKDKSATDQKKMREAENGALKMFSRF